MKLCRVMYEGGWVEKCISLGRFMHGVLIRGPGNLLSSCTSRMSGQKDCRVDKECCRVENASH